MSTIPENEVTQADLHKWYEVQAEIAKLKPIESMLRAKIFKGRFSNPVEGTNTVDLNDGWKLKGKYVLNRTIDQTALDSLREEFAENRIIVGDLVKHKPELVLSSYRQLTAEQQSLFDRALIVKEGMPGLEIVLPKVRGKKAAG